MQSRFNLSHGAIEDLLDEWVIVVSYESIRLWSINFGSTYSRRLRRRHQGYSDRLFIDEVLMVSSVIYGVLLIRMVKW